MRGAGFSHVTESPEKPGRFKPILKHFRVLASQGYIVPHVVSERAAVAHRASEKRFQEGSLGITILTTLACNLNCQYCFQSRSSQSMTIATAQTLVDTYAPIGGESIAVTWFGGEPLLNIPIIAFVTQRLRLRTKQYRAQIITNGTKLTPSTTALLRQLDVQSAQITIDGPRALHDAKRPTRGGRGSFDRILENVVTASKAMHIALRVNLSQGYAVNIDDFARFTCDIFSATSGRVSPYFAAVVGIRDRPRTMAHAYGDRVHFVAQVEAIYSRALELGYTGFIPWLSVEEGCVATSPRGIVVGPDGSLFKCWEEPGAPSEQTVGHLARNTQTEQEMEHERQYLGLSKRFLAECGECRYQPVCSGGCPQATLDPEHFGREAEVCSRMNAWAPMLARVHYRQRARNDTLRTVVDLAKTVTTTGGL